MMGVATLERLPWVGMKALLVFFDVGGPVGIKVAAQVDGSGLDDGLGHLFSQEYIPRRDLAPDERAASR